MFAWQKEEGSIYTRNQKGEGGFPDRALNPVGRVSSLVFCPDRPFVL